MRHSLAVKNLSIALEALSRIQQIGAQYYEVEGLLSKAIKLTEEELEPRMPGPKLDSNDDDISF